MRVRRRPARELRRRRGGGDDGDPPSRRRRDDRATRGPARDRDPHALLAAAHPTRPPSTIRHAVYAPAAISATPISAATTPQTLRGGEALTEHEAGQKDGDGRVERAGHRQPARAGRDWWRARTASSRGRRRSRSPAGPAEAKPRSASTVGRAAAATASIATPPTRAATIVHAGWGARGDVECEEEGAEPERGQRGEADRRAAGRAPLGVGLAGDEDHSSDAGCRADALDRGGPSPWITPGRPRAPRTPSAPIVATTVTEPRAIAR